MGLLQKVINRQRERREIDFSDPVVSAHFIIGLAQRLISSNIACAKRLFLSSQCVDLFDSLEPKERVELFSVINPLRLTLYHQEPGIAAVQEKLPQHMELPHAIQMVTFPGNNEERNCQEAWLMLASEVHGDLGGMIDLDAYLRDSLERREFASCLPEPRLANVGYIYAISTLFKTYGLSIEAVSEPGFSRASFQEV